MRLSRTTLDRLAFGVVLAVGAALRLWQYFGKTSLWVDELGIVANVLGRPLRALLVEPLLYDQVAPPGFLAALKGATALFGDGELALRVLPLAAALASLPLFAAAARRILDRSGALLATTFFALGIPFVRYGSEAKQYALDLAAALLLLVCALELPRAGASPSPSAPFWRAGIVGAVAVWFSQPAIFVVTGLGLAVATERLSSRTPRALGPLLPTLGLWIASGAASAAWNLRSVSPRTREFLHHFWDVTFPTLTWQHRFGATFLFTRLREFWALGMGYPVPTLFLAVTLLGSVALWRRDRGHALLLLAPVLVNFLAAAAHFYPFEGRLILYLAPTFLFAAAATAGVFIDLLARIRVPRWASGAIFALPALLVVAERPPVYYHEEARPLFEQLARRRRPGDAVYIFDGAHAALRYYGPRTGIDPSSVTLGKCHHGDLRAFPRELDQFRGQPRVWILIARSLTRLGEQATIRAYCNRIGRRLEGMTTPDEDHECSLELFDLSDAALLAAADAETFPLPPMDLRVAERHSCERGPN
jgi:hypothetical protein